MQADENPSVEMKKAAVEPPDFTILGSVEELALGGGSEAADSGVETAASKSGINPPGLGRTQ